MVCDHLLAPRHCGQRVKFFLHLQNFNGHPIHRSTSLVKRSDLAGQSHSCKVLFSMCLRNADQNTIPPPEVACETLRIIGLFCTLSLAHKDRRTKINVFWQEDWDRQIQKGGRAARQSSPVSPQAFSWTGPTNYGPDAWVSMVTAKDQDLLVCFESKQREWKGCNHSQLQWETVKALQILENVADDMVKTRLFDRRDMEAQIPGAPKAHCAPRLQAYLPSCSRPHSCPYAICNCSFLVSWQS